MFLVWLSTVDSLEIFNNLYANMLKWYIGSLISNNCTNDDHNELSIYPLMHKLTAIFEV